MTFEQVWIVSLFLLWKTLNRHSFVLSQTNATARLFFSRVMASLFCHLHIRFFTYTEQESELIPEGGSESCGWCVVGRGDGLTNKSAPDPKWSRYATVYLTGTTYKQCDPLRSMYSPTARGDRSLTGLVPAYKVSRGADPAASHLLLPF